MTTIITITTITTSPHHHITTPPHHLITSSPHHLIPTLLVTTSPHHFITTPLVATSPHHCTILSPHPSSPHLITASPHHLITRWPSTHPHITTSQESIIITTSLITTSPHHRVITMSSRHHQITSSPHHTITSSPYDHITTSQGSRKSREYDESRCEESRQSTVPFARPELEIAVELFRESDASGRIVDAMVSVVSISPNLLNLQLTSKHEKGCRKSAYFFKGVVQCLGQPCTHYNEPAGPACTVRPKNSPQPNRSNNPNAGVC